MAGAGKHRAKKEARRNNNGKNPPDSPETQESLSTSSPPQRSLPPTRYDGGADPAARGAINPGNNGNGNGVVAVRAHRNLDLGLLGSFLLTGVSLRVQYCCAPFLISYLSTSAIHSQFRF